MTLPDFKGEYMPSMIPAAPETYIVELSDTGNLLRTPIIAWAPDAENPYRAPHPITVAGLERLIKGRAVLVPGGMVHDRDHLICFNSVDEWKVIASKGPRTSIPADRPMASTKAHTVPKASANASAVPELKIEWTTQPFKTNSFYRYTADGLDFIFQIDGGVNPPKQKAPVEKIKRDDFMKLKATVDVADVTDLMEGRAPGLDAIGDFSDEPNDEPNEELDDLIGGLAPADDEEDLI